MQLHNWFARFLFSWQFIQCLCHFISNALHHINFIARPGSAIVALLQNHTAMGANRTAQRDAKQ
jgi:hypothetical protein